MRGAPSTASKTFGGCASAASQKKLLRGAGCGERSVPEEILKERSGAEEILDGVRAKRARKLGVR